MEALYLAIFVNNCYVSLAIVLKTFAEIELE